MIRREDRPWALLTFCAACGVLGLSVAAAQALLVELPAPPPPRSTPAPGREDLGPPRGSHPVIYNTLRQNMPRSTSRPSIPRATPTSRILPVLPTATRCTDPVPPPLTRLPTVLPASPTVRPTTPGPTLGPTTDPTPPPS